MNTGNLCNCKRKALLVMLALAAAIGAQETWDGQTLDTLWYTRSASSSSFSISTPEQLAGLSYLVGKGNKMDNKTFTLTRDIALNVTEEGKNMGSCKNENKWQPIGSPAAPFLGIFDGGVYVVRGVCIDESEDYQGLFGYVGGRGTIKRVRVAESYIRGNAYVGGLAGSSDSGRIEDCYSTATVMGSGYNVGGLVGYKKGAVVNSYATGDVTGAGRVGGLIGFGVNDTIKNSNATGAVVGDGDYVGGLVGRDSGKALILNSHAKGSVKGYGNYVGGLSGGSTAAVMNCYARGDVLGNDSVGGLVGIKIGSSIKNSYASGKVSKAGGGVAVGGLVGHLRLASITYGYYRKDEAGEVGLGIPKSTEDMQKATFTDMLNIAAYAMKDGGANRWIYSDGNFPTISGEQVTDEDFAACFAGGNGKESSPFLLEVAQHLENLAMYVNCNGKNKGMYFKMLNDIYLNDTTDWRGWGNAQPESVIEWTTIGQQPSDTTEPRIYFSGSFDGDGFVVGGVYINKDSDTTNAGRYQGLFGCVGVGAVVKNVGVVASYVNGYCYIGALAGSNEGKIRKCFSRANVSAIGGINGAGGVGGLVGINDRDSITSSYAMGSVSGVINMAGGLVGWNRGVGKITYCYATGDVAIIGDDVGGLVGRNEGGGAAVSIRDSYAAGSVLASVADIVGANGVASSVGGAAAGGLVGVNVDASLANCYAVGGVSGKSSVGGLVGLKLGTGAIGTSYYRDKAVAVINDHGTPKTDDEMKTLSTYVGWDTVRVWAIDAESRSYPYLGMVRAAKPVIITQPVGDSVSVGAAAPVLFVVASPGGVTYQWYSKKWDSNMNGDKIDGAVGPTYSAPTKEESRIFYYVVVTSIIDDNGDGGQKATSVSSNTAMVVVGAPQNAVLSGDREIPKSGAGKDAAAITPPSKLTAGLTAGPNPVLRAGGGVDLFYRGKRIAESDLLIYDAYGNVVNKVVIADAASAQSMRKVGSWDLTDAKGRRVSVGTYLVKGAVIGIDGKREKVSAVVGVR
jgi:hypothetical protein